jgi:RNA polymerase sigma-70 factor (ECF subfamily)
MDAHWIEQAKKGDMAAFNALVHRWRPKIYRYALRYFSRYAARAEDEPLALEVAQKTFISVYEGLGKMRQPDGFRTWLYRIAANHCHMEERRRKPEPLDADSDDFHLQSWVTGPEGDLSRTEMNRWLQEALRRIPSEQREVVLLKEYEGLTFREIAGVLGIPENTAKSRLYYGLKALRQVLESWRLSPEQLYHEH